MRSNYAVYQYRDGKYLCLDFGTRVRGQAWGKTFDTYVTFLYKQDREKAEKYNWVDGPLAVFVGDSFVEAKNLLISADYIEIE